MNNTLRFDPSRRTYLIFFSILIFFFGSSPQAMAEHPSICGPMDIMSIQQMWFSLVEIKAESALMGLNSDLKPERDAISDFKLEIGADKKLDPCEQRLREFAGPVQAAIHVAATSGEVPAGMIYSDSPVLVGEHNGRDCIVLGAAISPNVYNTVRLSSGEMAAKAMHSFIIPAMLDIADSLKDAPWQIYGLLYIYGARDFLSEDQNASAQELLVLAPKDLCSKLAQGKITEQEFSRTSEVFLRDGQSSTRLIRIVPQI